MSCSNCGRAGHNSRTCGTGARVIAQRIAGARARIRCSICRAAGHNAATCEATPETIAAAAHPEDDDGRRLICSGCGGVFYSTGLQRAQEYVGGTYRPGIHWSKVDHGCRPLCPGWDRPGRVVRVP